MPLPRCRIPILTVAGLIEIAALHGGHRDPLVAGAPGLIGAPGLYVVDLPGIAVTVETDGELADAGFGENVKDQVLVVGAGVFGGCAGLNFGGVGMLVSLFRG
jgi:hypothetical protein